MTRLILHVDLDAFYASVEELDHPDWKGHPLVVGADPQEGRGRGIVTTANYEARKFGVRSAMPISTAWRLCPQARYVEPRFERYMEKSDEVFAILRRAGAVEPASIDEGYLDVSSLGDFEAALRAARELQQEILRETGLSASFGVATNKLVAKIATDMQKPRGVTGVPPGTEEGFLAPLAARRIPGVGPKSEARLAMLGIHTCADLAAAPASLLSREFGVWGPRLAELARGVDDAPVETSWARKSLGGETTFQRDVEDPSVLRDTVAELAERGAASLAEEKLLARTVTLKIRLTGFETHTRARTLPRATDDAAALRETALALLAENAPPRAVRLLGVRLSHLVARSGQRDLRDWDAEVLGEARPWRPKQRRLDEA
ncbi:MAG: hypothetical protein QOE90_235 [Thermoplasmata archaeon]|nr:hypothetical protein [Thermoplasmata archaeon]